MEPIFEDEKDLYNPMVVMPRENVPIIKADGTTEETVTPHSDKLLSVLVVFTVVALLLRCMR